MTSYVRFAKSKFSEKCQEEKLAEIATFMNRVMLPRLGESFIQPVSVVELPHDQLQVSPALQFQVGPFQVVPDLWVLVDPAEVQLFNSK